jgi:hypothetical protein
MLDLREAIASLDHYIAKLDLQCELFRLTSGLEDSINPPAAGREHGVVDQLRASVRDSMILSILISKEFGRRVHHFIHDPLGLSKLVSAQTRMSVACQTAAALIEEHDRKANEERKG